MRVDHVDHVERAVGIAPSQQRMALVDHVERAVGIAASQQKMALTQHLSPLLPTGNVQETTVLRTSPSLPARYR
jgi:hypothetical protein